MQQGAGTIHTEMLSCKSQWCYACKPRNIRRTADWIPKHLETSCTDISDTLFASGFDTSLCLCRWTSSFIILNLKKYTYIWQMKSKQHPYIKKCVPSKYKKHYEQSIGEIVTHMYDWRLLAMPWRNVWASLINMKNKEKTTISIFLFLNYVLNTFISSYNLVLTLVKKKKDKLVIKSLT